MIGKVSAQPGSYHHPSPSPCGLVLQGLPILGARYSQDFSVFCTEQSTQTCSFSLASLDQLVVSQISKAGFQCLILTIINMQNILLNDHPLSSLLIL